MTMVEVEPSLWEAWLERDSDDLQVLFRSPRSAAEAYSVMRTAVATVYESAGDLPPQVACIAPVHGGVGLALDGGEELELLLEPLIRELAAADIPGVFLADERSAQDYPPYGPIGDGYLLGRAAFAGAVDASRDRGSWSVARSDVLSVVREALSWVAEAGPLRCVSNLVSWLAPDLDEAVELAELFLADGLNAAYAMAGGAGQWRHVHVAPWLGHIGFGTGNPSSPATAEHLIALLRRLAPSITYAYVTRASDAGLMRAGWRAATLWPQRDPDPSGIPAGLDRLERISPAEAFGVQFLTGDTTAVPADRWKIESVGHGALVTARDLTPWLSSTAVDPDVRVAARRDLSAVLW